MKEKIVFAIFNQFETWSSQLDFACKKGCSLCCTQNVTMTALEGRLIQQFIRTKKKEKWLTEILEKHHINTPPKTTANGFATSCLNGVASYSKEGDNSQPCPFLEDNCCSIYVVRPFGCRCFGSFNRCTSDQPAVLPEYYLSASTAVMQIMEHLGQHEPWGTLLDILRETGNNPPPETYQRQTLQAIPLPGFLIPEKDQDKVQEFMEALLAHKVGSKTLEQILNNQ